MNTRHYVNKHADKLQPYGGVSEITHKALSHNRNVKLITSCEPRSIIFGVTVTVVVTACCVGCSVGDFKCRNGQCIPSCKRCDGILDCYDYSDEDGCSKTRSIVMLQL